MRTAKNSVIRLLIAMIIFSAVAVVSASYYLNEEFAGLDRTKWSKDLRIGREGYIDYLNTGFVPTAAGQLWYGDGDTVDDQASGSMGAWCGMTVVLTNKKYSASEYDPFGFVVLLTQWNFKSGGASIPGLQTALFGVELVEVTPNTKVDTITNVLGGNFNSLVQIFNRRNNDVPVKIYWGSYVNGIERDFDLANAGRAAEVGTADLNSFDMKGPDSVLPVVTGTNTLCGIMIQHNGSQIKMYMNPNPTTNKNTGRKNEYMLLGTYDVSFNDNLRIAINQQVRESKSWADAWYSRLAVRSSIDSALPLVRATNNQQTVMISSNRTDAFRKRIIYTIKPDINPTNAGINVVKIVKPTGWGAWALNNLTNEIIVRTSCSNNGNLLNFNRVRAFSQYSNVATNQVSVRTNGDVLWIRLGKAIKSQTTKHIEVTFRLSTPTNAADLSQHVFVAYVDSKLITPIRDKQTNFSTCGYQRIRETSDSVITISAENKSPAEGLASIIPTTIVQGNSEYSFTYYLQASTNLKTFDINQAAIMIPPSFTIQTNTIDSFKLPVDAFPYITVGPVLSIAALPTNFIIIDYGLAGTEILAGGEMDNFTFKVKGTTTAGNWKWKAYVDGGTLSGASHAAKTNSVFVNQTVTVNPIPPKGPAIAYSSIGPNSIYQAAKDFTFTYYISTSEVVNRDNISSVAIEIPVNFTNAKITNFNSVLLGTNVKHKLSVVRLTSSATNLTKSKVIRIDYSSSPMPSPGGLDVISFQVLGNVTEGTTTWRCFVDTSLSLSSSSSNTKTNSSFESKAVIITPNLPAKAYASITPNIVNESSSSFPFTFYLSTVDVPDGYEDISRVVIEIPNAFTNTKLTNFNSVLMGTNENTLIRIGRTNIFSAPTNKKYIFLDYSSNRIASPGGLDVFSFIAKGSVQKGSALWRGWVDTATIDGASTRLSNNVDYPSLLTMVAGESPLVDGEITLPALGDPRMLFNTITKYTLEYKLRNTSSIAGNKIYSAIISAPGMFTNLKPLSTTKLLGTNFMKVGRLGAVTTLTLKYANAGLNIPKQDQDVIKFISWHRITTGSSNRSFSAVVNNSNGQGYMPVNTLGFVNAIFITDPKPVAQCAIEPVKGIVWTSDTTNRFKYTIKNTAPSGLIDYAQIMLPSQYFTNVTFVTSAKVPSGVITVSGSNIKINYSAAGKSITVGDYDVVTFKVKDKYKSTLPGSVVVPCLVTNNGSKKDFGSDLNNPWNRTAMFTPQPARVETWVSNNYVLTSTTTSGTLYYKIRNYGDPGNVVSNIKVAFSGTGGGGTITNISYVTSVLGGSSWLGGPQGFSNNSYTLDGGMVDVVKFVTKDSISVDTTRNLIATVTVNTSVAALATLPVGHTAAILFQTPPPFASIGISPNILFTSPLVKVTNHLTVTVYNNGNGSNNLYGVFIYIPSILQGKVTGVSAGGYPIINSASQVSVRYSATPLTVGSSNVITLVVTNSLSVRSNISWVIGVSNLDFNPPYSDSPNVTVLPGRMRVTSAIRRPDGFISLPAVIQDATITNTIIYKLANTSSTGMSVMKARIKVPTAIFTNVPNTLSSPWLNSAKAVSNGYIWLDYSANPLSVGAEDTITFKVFDNVVKGENTSLWPMEVKYYTNDSYYSTGTNGGILHLPIVMAPPAASVRLSRNYVYTTAPTNTLTLTITNMGLTANQISRARVFYPSSMNIVNVTSSTVSSANIKIGVSCVTLRYKEDGHLLNGGKKDMVTIKFGHSIPNLSTVTLRVMVNNTDPVVETFEQLASGLATIKSWPPPKVNVVASVPKIDISTYVNRFSFMLDNSGGVAPIQKAVIRFPATISSVSAVTSSYLAGNANITPLGITTTMTLNYKTNARGSLTTSGNTNYDNISFYAADTLNYGVGDFNFQCIVNDGTGWADTIVSVGGKKNVSYTNPIAVAMGGIDSSTIQLPVYTNGGSKVRVLKYRIDSQGLYANSIWYAQITLPALFTNYTIISQASAKGAPATTVRVGTNWLVRVNYSNVPGPVISGDFDTITIKLDNFTNRNAGSFAFACGVLNIPYYPAPNLKQIDSGARVQLINNSAFKIFAYLDATSTNIYTLDKKATLKYWVRNNSTAYAITNVTIDYDQSLFSNVQVTSALGGIVDVSILGKINVRYPAGSPLIYAAGDPLGDSFDTLTITLDYDVTNYSTQIMSCNAILGGTNKLAPASIGNSQVQRVQLSTWGRVKGSVFPANIPVSLELRRSDTKAVLASDIFGAPMAALTSDSNGNFLADLIPPGTYDVRFFDRNGLFDPDYYLTSILVKSNKILDVGTTTLRNAKLILDKDNKVSCWSETNAKLVLPGGTLGSNVFVDITKGNMTAKQQLGLAANSSIKDKDGSDLKVYNFDLKNSLGVPIDGVSLIGTGEIVLSYDTTQGWDTSKLAIYFWDDALGRWILIGGKESGNGTYTASVNYVHRVYAVLPYELTESGVIRAVTMAPNPFTPSSTVNNRLKIVFMLDAPASGVKINIFNMKGELIKTFQNFPDNIVNVETWWDGKDNDGYPLPAGIYIYQIRVGKASYSGSVLLAK